MSVYICVVLVILLSTTAYATADGGCDRDYTHVITVDGVNGDDTMCINGSLPCATLNMALKGITKNSLYIVCIEIRPGNYTLEYGEENELRVADDEYDNSTIAIIGSGMNETVINCELSAGLFIVFYQARIDSISFRNCGFNCCNQDIVFQQDTSISLPELGAISVKEHCSANVSIHTTRVAIITISIYITIENVAIYNSTGSGIAMICKSKSDIIITNSLITGGTSESNPSGGIVLLLFKGNYPLQMTLFNVLINHSNITNNNYSSGAAVTILSVTSSTQWYDKEPIELNVAIDSCFIMDNNRGLNYNHTEIFTDVSHKINVIFSVNNTQLSSSSNTSLMDMPSDNTVLDFHLIDVNITDFLNVTKKAGLTDLGKCYSNVLTVARSCSKHQTCHFPEIGFFLRNASYYVYNYAENDVKGPGVCSDNCIMEYYKGHHCPIPYSVVYTDGRYSCWDNHQGDLCGQCIEGHSVAINSVHLACVPCNDTMTVLKGWGLLIVLEFIPVTVMVAVIAVLNVNLNQGSLKAYIFFCQILTIPFPSVSYPSWFVIAYNYDFRIVNIPLHVVVFAIWNLWFISYPSYDFDMNYHDFSICISHNTTALGAIFFWYLIAFYPFILLFLLYLFVLAYDRGFHCVVCVMRPVHRLLARFWRKFNIQPSLPHTIASVYTLCFTQLVATSLKLLHFTTFDNQLRFFYDGSQMYFSGWHGAAGTLALIVLIVFIIVPVVYLSVYPFLLFQKCLNKVKIRKDLLISVTDVFTAPYSDGIQDTWDYRYYASSHFILQLLVMVLYYIPSPDYTTVIIVLQVCLCTLFLISLVVFRPHKRVIHVFTEAVLLFILIAFSLSMLYIIRGSSHQDYETHILTIITVFYPICGLFSFISFCFCCVWFIRKCIKRQQVTYKQPHEVIIAEDHDPNDKSKDDALLADRIANPSYYHSMSLNPTKQSN